MKKKKNNDVKGKMEGLDKLGWGRNEYWHEQISEMRREVESEEEEKH